MENFSNLKKICTEHTEISKKVIDNFRIYYSAHSEKTDILFDKRIAKFDYIAEQFDPAIIRGMKSQFIGHRIFKSGGLIHKYLKKSQSLKLAPEEINFLQQQAETPWRFSFCILIESPAKDFYRMVDVFSGDQYLVYSHGMTLTLNEASIALWFLLLGSNGACWQTFGPMGAFMGFTPDDIFFFATEHNPTLETEDDICEDIEDNPIPYLMLLSGATYPATVTPENDLIAMTVSETDLENIDTDQLREKFDIKYSANVYKLSLKGWGETNHRAIAYYSEEEKLLQLTAMTQRGYDALSLAFQSAGFQVSPEPDILVSPIMFITTSDVLNKELVLLRYEKLFDDQISEAEQEDLDKINKVLALALPALNAGQQPDVERIAKETGTAITTAQQIITLAMNRTIDLKKKTVD
jgi:hypothetical protein